ncbi:hypothetical protein ACWDAO_19470 [Streptomyces sp. NPDC001212]
MRTRATVAAAALLVAALAACYGVAPLVGGADNPVQRGALHRDEVPITES